MGGLHEQVVQTPCHIVHYCYMSAFPSLETYGQWCGNVSLLTDLQKGNSQVWFPDESIW